MVEIYRTDQQVLSTLDDIQEGCWINMVDPTNKEIEQIAKRFEIEPEDIASALVHVLVLKMDILLYLWIFLHLR